MNLLGNNEEITKIQDIKLIKLFVKNIKDSTEELMAIFTSYANNFEQIKRLYDSRLDKSEASRQKIESILQKSIFILSSEKNKFFEGKYFELDNTQQKETNIDIDQLLQLRDRAQLAKKITGDENEKKIMKQNKQFILISSEINTLLIQLRKISISGYPSTIIVKIEINNNEPSYSCRSETSYEQILKSLKDDLNNLRKHQLDAYEKFPLVRFIYGSQFNLINRMEHQKIYPLLMYITRNKMTNQKTNFRFPSCENNIKSIIDNCKKYLEENLKENQLDLSLIYKDSLIYNEYKYKGLYIKYIDKSEK